MTKPSRFAPSGSVWVCRACGKTARDQYGIEGEHSPGWDESCVLNAILCEETSLLRGRRGLVKAIVSAAVSPADEKEAGH